mgnify:CR=1 FL=1
MSNGALLLVIAFLLSLPCISQQHSFTIGIQKGLNRVFVGAPIDATKIGHSSSVKLGYMFSGKNSKFYFEPALHFSRHSYYSPIEENVSVKLSQISFDVRIVTGILLSERTILKVGLFAQALSSSRIDVISKHNSTYYSYGNSSLFVDYYPRSIQAGIITAVSYALGKKKRFSFEVILQQFATSFLDADYLLDHNASSGPDLVFNNKSRPTILSIGVNFRLEKSRSE